MASTDTESRRLELADLTVVDADSHLTETPRQLLPYLDEQHEAIQRLFESSRDPAYDVYSAHRASPAFAQTRGENSTDGKGLVHDAVIDPEPKQEVMAEFDIDHTVVTPGLNLILATVNHDPTAVALATGYNRYVTDTFGDADGMKATLVVAPQRPERAAEEIDEWGDHDDIVGVQFPADGLAPPAGHSRYDPIYEAAQDHGLPVVLHSGDAGAGTVFPIQRNWAETFTEAHAFSFPAQSIWQLISQVCLGVPERYPDLDFVIQESGCEWVPWLMWRLDDHYLQNSGDLPILEKLPSEYITDQYHFTTQPLGHTENAAHLARMLEMAGGADTLLFATDHPHPDFDPPGELFEPIRSHLDDEEVRGMMGETAMDVFGL